MLPCTHITNMYDKMLTNCSISNDPVITPSKLITVFLYLLAVINNKILDKESEGILSASVCGF